MKAQNVSALLGTQITRKGKTIELKQDGLTGRILQDTGMEHFKPELAVNKALGKNITGQLSREV